MHVNRIVSINDGYSFLTNSKPKEWKDLLEVLDNLDLELIEYSFSKAEAKVGEMSSFGVDYLNALIGVALNAVNNEWPGHEAVAGVGSERHNPVSFSGTKNGVAILPIGTHTSNGGDFVSNVFIKIPYYFNAEIAEVAILLIPTTEAINLMTNYGNRYTQLNNLPTEKICREQLIKFGPITSKAPAVILFYSMTEPPEVLIDEIYAVRLESHPSIERTIEFAPEYYQAGVGLLSYFGEVLRQKDPTTKAKVRIEQDGRIVRLRIESPGGDIETIEKELDQYALVISNQAPPESLFDNRVHIMQLESKLAVTQVELKGALDTKQLLEGIYSHQIRDLRQQVDDLKQQVATQLLHQGQFINLVSKQNDSHERVQLAMLTHAQDLFTGLLADAQGNQVLLDAITSLRQHLLSGLNSIEVEDQIKAALATIKQAKPGFLPRMLTELEGATYKAAAGGAVGAAVTWLAQHM